jgi:hypothetical protein
MEYTRDFHYNTKGEDVRAFQNNLMKLGYPLPQFGADGWYGAETEGAAKKCCEDYHWDYCSWGEEGGEPPCPVWLQERVDETANVDPEPTGWMPEGRGMWIQSMNTIDGPEEVEKVVNAVGLKWVCIQAHWQYTSKESRLYNWPDDFGFDIPQSYGCTENARLCIEKFRELGVHVIPFSYPVPGKHQEVIDVLEKYAEAWGSPCVVIDPEAEWKNSDGAYKEDALELSALLDGEFDSWGMSTYGAPWYHRSFPYAEFNSATFGLPQTYTPGNFGTEEKYGRARDEWAGYGFKFLVGLYGTYKAETRVILTACASFEQFATAGWKWGTTSDVEWDEIDSILPE